MVLVKKYIHFLLMIGLCFHFTDMVAGDTYIPVPDFGDAREVVESGTSLMKNFSEVVDNHPAMVIAPVVCAVGGLLFVGRQTIHGLVLKKYEQLEQELKYELECKAANIQNEVDNKISPITRRILMTVLRPFATTMPEYWQHNKWHMATFVILCVAGRLLGYPITGGCSGGLVLAKGHWDQGWAATDKKIDGITIEIAAAREDIKRMDEKNTKLHNTTKATVDKVDESVKALSKKLDETGDAIKKQIGNLEATLSGDIQSVGKELCDFSGKLKDVPQQILKLMGDLKTANENLEKIDTKNTTIIRQNAEMAEKTKELSEQLVGMCANFASTKEELDALGKMLTEQMKKSSEETKTQLNEIQLQAKTQTEDLTQIKEEIKQKMQMQEEMAQKFEKLFADVTKNNQLLQSFENVQESHGNQLIDLIDKINASEKRDVETLNIMSKLMEAQEASSVNYATIVTNLAEIRKMNTESMNDVSAKATNLQNQVTNLQELLVKLNSRMDQVDEEIAGIKHEIKDGNNKLSNEIGVNRDATRSLEKTFQNSEVVWKQKHKKLKKLLEESNSKISELTLVILNLSNKLNEACRILNKKLDENKGIAIETNSMVKNAVGTKKDYETLLFSEDERLIFGSKNKVALSSHKLLQNEHAIGQSVKLFLAQHPSNGELRN